MQPHVDLTSRTHGTMIQDIFAPRIFPQDICRIVLSINLRRLISLLAVPDARCAALFPWKHNPVCHRPNPGCDPSALLLLLRRPGDGTASLDSRSVSCLAPVAGVNMIFAIWSLAWINWTPEPSPPMLAWPHRGIPHKLVCKSPHLEYGRVSVETNLLRLQEQSCCQP